jgi:hypothetical protein
MHFRLDHLAKNLLRDVFALVGAADTEVEVPAGDAQRLDLWHVPDPDLLRAHPEIEPGLLRTMAETPGAVEIYSAAPDVDDLHDVLRKRFQWHHALELRARARLPLAPVWILCAGRPDGLLQRFAFAPVPGAAGLYAPAGAGWELRLVAVGDLPRERATILLRLLGSAAVRRRAFQDLAALPPDAWERRVALPWLIRLHFELPKEIAPELDAEERSFIMETREWFAQWQAERKREEDAARQQAVQEAEHRAEQQAELRHLAMIADLYALRLGRSLTDAERTTLADRLARFGHHRLNEAVLSSTADALAAWLADPAAQ